MILPRAPKMVIILACSKDKVDAERCAAGDLYLGTIFRKGRGLAERYGIPYVILSAKYGFLKHTTVVDHYDQKFKKPFPGPFPDRPWHGFFLGGQLYFKNAPAHFEPLVPPSSMGYMLQSLKRLEDDPQAAYNLFAEHISRFPE